MTRPGDVDEPTIQWPEYTPGRAEPTEPGGTPPPPEPPDEWAGLTGPVKALVALGVVVAVLATLVVGARSLLPGFHNPFAGTRTDRSQPVLLQSMRDLSRFVGAEGNFQVIVDLQDRRQNIPPFLLGNRTLFVAAGTVEAYVDFGQLGAGSVTVTPDGKGVTVNLPAPQLGKASLDMDRSYVYAEERGLLNRVADLVNGDPNRQQQIYQLGEQRITAAARDSGLLQRAQDNTRKMLDGLLKSLGYTSVTVNIANP
jgi:hypothetical protein